MIKDEFYSIVLEELWDCRSEIFGWVREKLIIRFYEVVGEIQVDGAFWGYQREYLCWPVFLRLLLPLRASNILNDGSSCAVRLRTITPIFEYVGRTGIYKTYEDLYGDAWGRGGQATGTPIRVI